MKRFWYFCRNTGSTPISIAALIAVIFIVSIDFMGKTPAHDYCLSYCNAVQLGCLVYSWNDLRNLKKRQAIRRRDLETLEFWATEADRLMGELKALAETWKAGGEEDISYATELQIRHSEAHTRFYREKAIYLTKYPEVFKK